VEAAAGTHRKLRNLGCGTRTPLVRNFGGRSHELWCPGGEVGFVSRMIAESARQPELCGWFTTLVSSRESLPVIERALQSVKPTQVRIIAMAQGQKKSRMVAWSFGR
jgi:23S rRNA (adenine1618-N6)-methyltransferase